MRQLGSVMSTTCGHSVAKTAGVGLRLPHILEVAGTRPRASWFEIHPENFLANPHARELLLQLAEDYPISVHTVGISIGSACGIDVDHLERIAALIDAIDPILVSGHLAWSTHAGEYLNDLLPLPYDDVTLALMAEHVGRVQDRLGRRFLVENPSSYLRVGVSTMSEVQFLAELSSRTGCGLLCDVSNIFLSGHNMGFDPRHYLDAFPGGAVAELHLGGFTLEPDGDGAGGSVMIDTHAARITEPVWDLYRHAVRRFGPQPTLIEWDNDLPDLGLLLEEAARADVVSASATSPEAAHAATG